LREILVRKPEERLLVLKILQRRNFVPLTELPRER
jgi:hypothetical protein